MAWMCGQLQVKTGWLVNSTQRTVTTPYHRDLYWDLSCLIALSKTRKQQEYTVTETGVDTMGRTRQLAQEHRRHPE